MKKQKLKTNKGITLVALIITIIMLLILATVSIKLLIDQGIITRSKSATNRYAQEQEKELITLAYTDYKIAKAENGEATLTVEGATVSGDETSGWTIKFPNGNEYKLASNGEITLPRPKTEEEKLLERYFLGKNENGTTKILEDVMDLKDMTFKDIEGAVIPDGSTKFAFLNATTDTEHCYVIVKYENKVYELKCDINTFENKAVELVYAPTGREGQTVKYSYDGKVENEKDWTILYDYGDTVEIISTDVMGSLTLGYLDEEAQTPGDIDKNGEENTDLDKAIYSYNNAIKRINNYCSSLITNSNKISVRSVGSNPITPQAEGGMYKSETLQQIEGGKYNGVGKSADKNYEEDLFRMSFYGIDRALNGSNYWLASRIIDDDLNGVYFLLRDGNNLGNDYKLGLWRVVEGRTVALAEQSNAVRPIVKISSDSIKQ